MFRIRLMIAGVALGTCSVTMAQDYFDFGSIPGVSDQPAIQLDLDPMLLGFATATTRAENPAVAELLSGIDGVRIRVYKDLQDVGDIVDFVDEASNRLERDNWQRAVSVQDRETIRVHFRGEESLITGVTAMFVSEREAIFVNVVGTITAEQLARSIESLGAGDMLASLGQINLGNVQLDPDD